MVREDAAPAPATQFATTAVRLQRIEAVVNPASGGVGPGAADALRAIIADFGLSANVTEAAPNQIEAVLTAAVAAKPDVLIILAGDGTARLAAELAGPDGPLLAPLPGGTMNMLPRALYDTVDWRMAVTAALTHGQARPVSGGRVGGRAFYVAAILGSPALWADAREAVRSHKLKLALQRAERAWKRAFAGRLHFDLADDRLRKAEALTLMCPLVSRALGRDDGLEADALDPHGAAEAFRLGLRAAFGGLLGDWRKDPSVTTEFCRSGSAWGRGGLPAILDGEPHRFPRRVQFAFEPVAFRALAPPKAASPEIAASVIGEAADAVQ